MNTVSDANKLQTLGLECIKTRDYTCAIEYFKEAIRKDPSDPRCHNNLGNAYKALRQFTQALIHYHEALRLNPHSPEVYNNLGNLHYIQGLFSDAVPYFEKALRAHPTYWEAHYNLAHSFTQLNQFMRAATHYQEVLYLAPEHPFAHLNLGILFFDEANYEKAIFHLEKSLSQTSNIEARYRLAASYVEVGELEAARLTYESLLEKDPEHSDSHHNLGILLLRLKDKEKALSHFEKAYQFNPENETAHHMMNALSGNQQAHKAPDTYVSALFDQYADHYTHHVQKSLNYQVPHLLRTALGQVIPSHTETGIILDLGCGTGLCGLYFRDLAYYLVGIDLSPNMIEQSRALNAYNLLKLSSVEEALSEHQQYYDTIIAGDVFGYVGSLETVFRLASLALKPNAYFTFSVEALDTGTFFLQPSGRFAHSQEYIHALSHQYLFSIQHEAGMMLREQEGNPIMGYIFVLKLKS